MVQIEKLVLSGRAAILRENTTGITGRQAGGTKLHKKKRVTIQDKVLVRGFWNTEGKRTISKRGSPILHIETADYFQTSVEFLLLLLSSDKRLQAVTKRTSQQMM